MFSPRDLIFVLCSRDLDVLRAQRSMRFYYPQINEVGKSDHMGNNRLGCNLAISKADTEAVFNHSVAHKHSNYTARHNIPIPSSLGGLAFSWKSSRKSFCLTDSQCILRNVYLQEMVHAFVLAKCIQEQANLSY